MLKKNLLFLVMLIALTSCSSNKEYIKNDNQTNCAYTSNDHYVDETLVVNYYPLEGYESEIEEAANIWNELDIVEFVSVNRSRKADFSFVSGQTEDLVTLEHITYDYDNHKIYIDEAFENLSEDEQLNIFLKSFGLTLGLKNTYSENIMYGAVTDQITIGKRDEEAYYCMWFDYKNR